MKQSNIFDVSISSSYYDMNDYFYLKRFKHKQMLFTKKLPQLFMTLFNVFKRHTIFQCKLNIAYFILLYILFCSTPTLSHSGNLLFNYGHVGL